MSDEAVYRTALATPGLLIILRTLLPGYWEGYEKLLTDEIFIGNSY